MPVYVYVLCGGGSICVWCVCVVFVLACVYVVYMCSVDGVHT